MSEKSNMNVDIIEIPEMIRRIFPEHFIKMPSGKSGIKIYHLYPIWFAEKKEKK